MHARDLRLDLIVAPGKSRTLLRVGKAGRVFVVARGRDCQLSADRINTRFLGVCVDERHHHMLWAQAHSYARGHGECLAELRLCKICRGPVQYLVGPPKLLYLALSHRRSRSLAASAAVQPIFAAIEVIAAHSAPWSTLAHGSSFSQIGASEKLEAVQYK